MDEHIQNYINQLNEKEKNALSIAKEHLDTSFNISKSIGFINYISTVNK